MRWVSSANILRKSSRHSSSDPLERRRAARELMEWLRCWLNGIPCFVAVGFEEDDVAALALGNERALPSRPIRLLR
jgi:hypothetical protein